MQDLSIQIKSIIDLNLKETKNALEIDHKDDGTLVSSADIKIQKDLINFFKSYFYQDIKYIGEEGFLENDMTNLGENFCIIDPIDGTENFISGLPIYGSTISLKLKNDFYNAIYVPAMDIYIDNSNIQKFKDLELKSDISLYSTKCLNQKIKNIDNARVLGSSSFMFYLFLTKQVRSYTYCVGAKIWDCYAGIALAKQMGAKIEMNHDLDEWLDKPVYKTEFKLLWDNA